MTNSSACDYAAELLELDEARSLFWTIRQLTASSAAQAASGRSYLFELHQLASRGLMLTERLIERCEPVEAS